MKNCPKCGNEHFKPGIFCSRHCANSRVFTEESKNKTRLTMLGNGEGRSLSNETKAKISATCKKRNFDYLQNRVVSEETKAKISVALTGRKHTDEFKKLMSEYAIKTGLGGHTSKRRIYFKRKNGEEIYLQSSYEIRFAELLELLDIEWSRPSPLCWIDDYGNNHRYYPDFKIGNVYVDTKNSYLAIKDENKIAKVRIQNNIDLRIVLEKDITEEYIRSLV